MCYVQVKVLWVLNYFSNLKELFGNRYSGNLYILTGVSQGSILNPLLSIIYTADIIKYVNNSKVIIILAWGLFDFFDVY